MTFLDHLTSSYFISRKIWVAVKLQGVQTLSGQSNLPISPTKFWSIFEILYSIWPLEQHNLLSTIDETRFQQYISVFQFFRKIWFIGIYNFPNWQIMKFYVFDLIFVKIGLYYSDMSTHTSQLHQMDNIEDKWLIWIIWNFFEVKFWGLTSKTKNMNFCQ